MSTGRWEHICIVGYGGHARTKLMPAVAENGQVVAGIVTQKSLDQSDSWASTPRFENIHSASSALPVDTLFVIASPPTAHFRQIMPLLLSGRDVLVEKPAFVTATEAREATTAARDSGALLIEGFMNRYTVTHRRFISAWQEVRPSALELVFTIPSAPSGTFRSEAAIGSSNLFDMGCYLLATLSDVDLPLAPLRLVRAERAGFPDQELLRFKGDLNDVAVTATVGIADTYENRLKLHFPDSTIEFSPFIYGRPGTRTLVLENGGKTVHEQIEDVNAFSAMLAVPRLEWLSNQEFRSTQMVVLAAQLERMGDRLASLRRPA